MRKTYFIIIAICFCWLSSASQVAFQKDEPIENTASLTPAASNGEEVFTLYLFAHTDEIISQALLQYVFNNNPGFASYVNSKFKPILITQNDEKWEQWACKLRLRKLPAIAVFNQEGFLLGQVWGYKSAEELQRWLYFTTGKRMVSMAFQSKSKEMYPDFYKASMVRKEATLIDTPTVTAYLGRFGTTPDEVVWNLAREYMPLLGPQALRLYDNQNFLFQHFGIDFMLMQYDHATYIADTLKLGTDKNLQNTIIPQLRSFGFSNIDHWERFILAHQAVYRKDWKNVPVALAAYAADSTSYLFRLDSLASWCRSVYENSTDKQSLFMAEKVLRENKLTHSRPDYLALLGLIQCKNQKWYDAEVSLKRAQNHPLLIMTDEQKITMALAEIEAKKNKAKKK